VKLNGYVNCEPEFDDLPRVTDAASKLLVDLFGDSGRHAQTTVGVASLPQGVAVEIELIAQFERA
jgi:enamine deaminase RidA (YjgF/YER057c/UK114 family)